MQGTAVAAAAKHFDGLQLLLMNDEHAWQVLSCTSAGREQPFTVCVLDSYAAQHPALQ